jgi:glycosyltransferase involved in cell wall biosynthesis
MRVIIARRVPGSTFSMEVYADNLVAGLKAVRPDWNIEEIAPIPWSSPDQLWQSGTGLRKYYETFWRHPHAVSQLDADIFHIIDQCDGHIAYWLKQKGKAVVVTCHDLVQLVYPEILRDQSRIPAISMAVWRYSIQGMNQCDQVIAVSTNTAQDVAHFLKVDSRKVTVVPNGVETHYRVLELSEKAVLRQQYAPSSDSICLLNVGSTHHRKNILTVLQVVKRLKDQGLPVCLWRTGGKFTPEQQSFIQHHQLEQQIIHLGSPDKEALVKIYNAADMLIAPSLYEGFGLTIVEAMACGLPVITSNGSSLPEVAGDAAVLVDPTDVDAISTAVCQIHQDAHYRQQLIDRGLTRIKRFSWNNTAEQIAQAYEKIYCQDA